MFATLPLTSFFEEMTNLCISTRYTVLTWHEDCPSRARTG